MDMRHFRLTEEDAKPVTKEELIALPTEELLIIAKYMRISCAKELNKEDLAEVILFRERTRAPFPNEDNARFVFGPYLSDTQKRKVKNALKNIEDILISIIE